MNNYCRKIINYQYVINDINLGFNNILTSSYLGMTKTILIIKDDTELLDLYVEILQVNMYNVQTAIDGEAVSKYRQIHPDLVVVDGICQNLMDMKHFLKS